jgi:hypothetical protein
MAYSWVSVPNSWWSTIDVYNDPPLTGWDSGWFRLTAYCDYTLSNTLTDEQRRPSKIRVNYTLSGTANSSPDGYQASVYCVGLDGNHDVSGTTSVSGNFSENYEDNTGITPPDYFTGFYLYIQAEIYGSNPASPGSGSVVASVSSIEFYIDLLGPSEIWTSFVNTIEENI